MKKFYKAVSRIKKMEIPFMLAEIGSQEIFEKKDWIFEPKLDGTRVAIVKEGSKIRLINRRGKDISYRYPELRGIVKNIKVNNCILDAELVVLNKKGKPDFNLLQQREQLDNKVLIELKSAELPATLFVFDVLQIDKRSTVALPLKVRKELLDKIIEDSEFITKCPYTFDGKKLWEKVREQGLEGVMAKKIDSAYEGKRSKNWLKIKNLNTIDAIVVGFTRGKGVREKLGALVLACYDRGKLTYVGKVGTGFDGATIDFLLSQLKKITTRKPAIKDAGKIEEIEEDVVWVKPMLIAEVKFLELTKDKKLRAPSFMRLRFDKKLQDCTI
jgi:bifunctional non-homologous end joining protein LigD